MTEDNSPIKSSSPTLRVVAYLVLTAAVVWANWNTYSTANEAKLAGETARKAIAQNRINGRIARHQICLADERDHAREVERLKGVYEYLTTRTEEQLHDDGINETVLRQLPQYEDRATLLPPAFCNAPNVGQPEPDPRIPLRPKELCVVPGKTGPATSCKAQHGPL